MTITYISYPFIFESFDVEFASGIHKINNYLYIYISKDDSISKCIKIKLNVLQSKNFK